MRFQIIAYLSVVLLVISCANAFKKRSVTQRPALPDSCRDHYTYIAGDGNEYTSPTDTLSCGPDFTNFTFLQLLDPNVVLYNNFNFSGNNVQVIARDSFRIPALRNLVQLRLTANHIQRIESGAFQILNETLRLIDLSNNSFSSITNETFSGLGRLRSLALENNKISSIESGSFNGLTNLGEILLSNNDLTAITSNMFVEATNLRYLILNRNRITKIEPNAFFGPTDMQFIDLAFNYFNNVPENTFSLSTTPLICHTFKNDLFEINENNEFENATANVCISPNDDSYPKSVVNGRILYGSRNMDKVVTNYTFFE